MFNHNLIQISQCWVHIRFIFWIFLFFVNKLNRFFGNQGLAFNFDHFSLFFLFYQYFKSLQSLILIEFHSITNWTCIVFKFFYFLLFHFHNIWLIKNSEIIQYDLVLTLLIYSMLFVWKSSKLCWRWWFIFVYLILDKTFLQWFLRW